MEKNMDFGGYSDMDPMFNPVMQYEQACMYYKYLTAQMEYKIKCKEFDKLCRGDSRENRRVE